MKNATVFLVHYSDVDANRIVERVDDGLLHAVRLHPVRLLQDERID